MRAQAMHISSDEAIWMIEKWRDTSASLRVHLRDRREPLHATVESVSGTVVRLIAGGDKFAIDIQGADFNGDDRSRDETGKPAYLVCEFSDGDRCSFYEM
jgi:hypothetical protein